MELGWGKIETARLALAQLEIADSDDALERGLGAAARISAKSLGVERVGVWLFQDDGETIQCIYQFDCRAGRPNVEELSSIALPSYVKALRKHRFIVASDALTDPVTRELAPFYLEPLGIRAILDAPIYRGSELIGIVCHEHGNPRAWSLEERHLAATTADIVALLFEQSRRLETEKRLRETRAKLRELALLDDLSRSTAGVAHDLNNLLTVALNGAQLLEAKAEDVALVRAMAGEIRSVSERAVALSQRFLTFRRPPTPPMVAVDLAALVEELEAALTAVAAGVDLELTLDRPTLAFVDARLFEQVVFNLVKNARDASNDGARIWISVASRPRTDGVPAPTSVPSSGAGEPVGPDGASAPTSVPSTGAGPSELEAVLVVRDEGSGMTPDVRAHATEAFFTTRAEEGGSGLGLDIVATIARESGGRLTIESTPGVGTTVEVVLPGAAPES